MSSRTRIAAAAVAGVLAAGTAVAFNVFPYGTNQASKWGSNTIGTPGGLVTWSLMPDGTTQDPSVASLGFTGTSNLSSVFNQVGGEAAALAAIQAAFDAWSSVTNIQFVQITESGAPLAFGAPYPTGGTSVVGSIRIGAFAFAAGDYSAGEGYAPPPNGGTTLEGDIVFNVSNTFFIPAGAEGSLYNLYPPGGGAYRNDFAGLIAHEIGHGIGLWHTNVTTALMCGYLSSSFDGSQCYWADPLQTGQAPITRLPKADDIAGAQYLYGTVGVVDTDGDGFPDHIDNCPHTANPDQKDSGGVGSGSPPDGIGDACQCGDVNNDGIVNSTDATLIRRAVAGLAPNIGGVTTLPGATKCDVNANGTCDNNDASIILRAVAGLAPAIKQGCHAATTYP